MKKLHSGRIISLILFLVIGLAGVNALAQKFLENYKIPMPEFPLPTPEEFEKSSRPYSDMPLGDKALAFEIHVPKDWEMQKNVGLTNISIGNKLLGELAKFYGPPKLDMRSYLSIQAIKLDYKLTAEQWFLQYMLANSFTLQGIKTYNDRRVEALYVYVEKDTTYMVRTAAQINGKRVVLAQYYVPVKEWENEKQMQAQVVGSFTLPHNVDEYVEPMEKYHFLDIAELQYPKSWELHSDPLKSIDRLRVRLLSIASEETVKLRKYKLLNGKIEIDLVSYYAIDTMAGEIKNFKKELEHSGLMIQELIETKNDFELDKALSARPVEVYRTIDTENNVVTYELWLLVMEYGDYYYFITLLTPSRDEDYFVWSRNTQTFRMIAKTIEPQEGSLVGN